MAGKMVSVSSNARHSALIRCGGRAACPVPQASGVRPVPPPPPPLPPPPSPPLPPPTTTPSILALIKSRPDRRCGGTVAPATPFARTKPVRAEPSRETVTRVTTRLLSLGPSGWLILAGVARDLTGAAFHAGALNPSPPPAREARRAPDFPSSGAKRTHFSRWRLRIRAGFAAEWPRIPYFRSLSVSRIPRVRTQFGVSTLIL